MMPTAARVAAVRGAESDSERGMGGSAEQRLPQAQRTLLVCAAAVCIASSGLLVKASQVGGIVLYSKFSVTLLAESLKLTIAGALWLRELRQQRQSGAGPCHPARRRSRPGSRASLRARLYSTSTTPLHPPGLRLRLMSMRA